MSLCNIKSSFIILFPPQIDEQKEADGNRDQGGRKVHASSSEERLPRLHSGRKTAHGQVLKAVSEIE